MTLSLSVRVMHLEVALATDSKFHLTWERRWKIVTNKNQRM